MSQHHILLVDDEPHVLRVLRLSLERAGYSVATANDGNDALSEIAKCRPDVLVTDIKMDGMSGRTLCPLVRKMYPEDLFLILVMTSMICRRTGVGSATTEYRIPRETSLSSATSSAAIPPLHCQSVNSQQKVHVLSTDLTDVV
jgi:CheY-like chemotaxis protein